MLSNALFSIGGSQPGMILTFPPTRGHLAISEDIFDMTVVGRGVMLLAFDRWRPGMLLNTPLCTRRPTTKSDGAPMSSVMRWRRSDQEADSKGSMLYNSIIGYSGKGKTNRGNKYISGHQELRLREGEWLLSSTRAFEGGWKCFLSVFSVVVVTCIYVFVNTHKTVH